MLSTSMDSSQRCSWPWPLNDNGTQQPTSETRIRAAASSIESRLHKSLPSWPSTWSSCRRGRLNGLKYELTDGLTD
jgi:hypothetical protein